MPKSWLQTKKYPAAEYEVELTTTNIDFAGTGSPIYYTFVGTKGSTPEFLAPGDRYKGRTDVLTFSDSTKIGKFKCLNVRLAGSDGWHIQEVRFALRLLSFVVIIFDFS